MPGPYVQEIYLLTCRSDSIRLSPSPAPNGAGIGPGNAVRADSLGGYT